MPTNSGGLDEWNRYMGMLRMLMDNYNRAIKLIQGDEGKADFELYQQILADDKKIREVLNG